MKNRPSSYSALRYTLFAYTVCVVLLITLMPFNFDFHIPRRIRFAWHGDLPDILSNIFLFIPLGFLYRLCFRQGRGRLCLQELMLGLLMSLAIEALQIFLPSRKPTVADVLTNGSGVWLGAQLDVLVMSRLNRDHLVKLFALELPLMALICFLTPLLWISAYTTHIYPNRLVLILLLGLFGSGIWHSIFVHRLRPEGHLSEKKMLFMAVAWFFISSTPALINVPWHVAVMGALMMAALVLQMGWQIRWPPNSADRRFEVATLKRYLPLYAAYLFLLMLWPPKPEIFVPVNNPVRCYNA
ncbi:hypothetical protein DENIS_2988 [Desulfonema ishimotonii]|uniref:VanZ-like domain-containing protein n=1 Tax=Desulfonema ishimotonii TaxID=45657 RepID=A0A401FYI9_9BACT|nr:VanZ family protein [Desulfonema ishimotonii]GBC62025.1 hypothetical protein DENIS_2988 [Desulfonema ishimotonii]